MTQKQKRPGEAATSSEPMSNSTPTGEQMNLQTDNTDSAERLPLYGPQTAKIDLDVLETLSITELEVLYKDIRTINDVVSGALCRPCYQSKVQDYTQNEAGKLLDKLHEFLCTFEQAVINAARASHPTKAQEVADRGNLLLLYDAWCAEGFLDIATMAMVFAKQESEAKASERRAAA